MMAFNILKYFLLIAFAYTLKGTFSEDFRNFTNNNSFEINMENHSVDYDSTTINYNTISDNYDISCSNSVEKKDKPWMTYFNSAQAVMTAMGFVLNLFTFVTFIKNGDMFSPVIRALLKHQAFADMLACVLGIMVLAIPPMQVVGKNWASFLICQVILYCYNIFQFIFNCKLMILIFGNPSNSYLSFFHCFMLIKQDLANLEAIALHYNNYSLSC